MDAVPGTPPQSGVPEIGAEDPDPQTSHFFRLPGELRNRVYEFLFLHEGRIAIPDEQIPDVLKAAIPGINLLSTCRQIHAEAAGILYGRNGFTVAGHSSSCDNDEFRHISQLGPWLKSIGKLRDSLSNIYIDLSTVCAVCTTYPAIWPSPVAKIDLSIIMEQSDMHPVHNPIITFLPNATGIIANPRYNFTWDFVTALNALFQQLSGAGESVLNTCVRLKRRCQFIDCTADGDELSFGLYKSAPPIEFCRTSDGTFERKAIDSGQRNFFSSREHPKIFDTIFGATKETLKTYVFNINDKTVTPPLPATFHVSKQFRILTFLHNRDRFVATCSVQNKAASPRIFKDLEQWVLHGRVQWFLNSEEQCTYKIEPQILNLEIESSVSSANDPPCFDAIVFVWATLGLNDYIGIGRGPAPFEATVTMYCLRRRVLHFLEFLAKLPPHSRTPSTPVIWMDESFKVRFATFRPKRGGFITIQNEDPDWAPPKRKMAPMREFCRLGIWSRTRLDREQRHREQTKLKLDGKEVREKRLRKTLCGTLRLLKEHLREIYGDV